MNALLIVLLLMTGAGIVSVMPGEGAAALSLAGGLAILSGAFICLVKDDREFLLRIFAAGLILRLGLSTVINLLALHDFFGPDVFTYDAVGDDMQRTWENYGFELEISRLNEPNYGMGFIVAAVYAVVGRSILAVQFFNSVIGAATAVVIYLCARTIFESRLVARVSALCVAFYPSLILWSAQGLKDAAVVFCITLVMLATLRLGGRIRISYMIVLVIGLVGILSLRFYVFYMAVVAATGALAIGTQRMADVSLLRQFAVVMMIGIGLAYVGVRQTAAEQLGTITDLNNVQYRRAAMASEGSSSAYNTSADVSTASGALSAIPTNMIYLLFAPFPWQLTNLRQSITLPEMVVWWLMVPFLILGLWFTLKFRVRQAFAILLFTSMLTLAYSVFQGNLGAAYRQRSQLLVFYFIFVAVGLVLLKERRDERVRAQAALKERRQSEVSQGRRERRESYPRGREGVEAHPPA